MWTPIHTTLSIFSNFDIMLEKSKMLAATKVINDLETS